MSASFPGILHLLSRQHLSLDTELTGLARPVSCLQHWGSSIQYWNKRCGHVLGAKDPNSCPNVGCKCFTCWAILPAPFPDLFKTTDSYSIKFVRYKKEYSLNSSPAPKTEKSILRMWSIPDLMSTSHQFKIQESYGFLFTLLSLIND